MGGNINKSHRYVMEVKIKTCAWRTAAAGVISTLFRNEDASSDDVPEYVLVLSVDVL